MTQSGPRDVTSVLDSRYWLTDTGWALACTNQGHSPQAHDHERLADAPTTERQG